MNKKDYQSHTHVYYDRRAHVYEHASRKKPVTILT